MSERKLTAEEELLTVSFGNCYERTLPREDDELFIFLVAIDMAKNSCYFARCLLNTQDLYLLSRYKILYNERKIDMLSKCYQVFMKYICEVKGFSKADRAKLYHSWYKAMRERFTKDSETWNNWSERISTESEYILQVNEKHMATMQK